MAEKQYDVIIVGAGPGGYVAAIRAAQLGASVALVEAREVGGTCLNRGCIPSKALIKCAELVEEFKGAKAFGITAGTPEIDFDAVRKHKERTVKSLVSGVGSLLKARQVEVFNGRGSLLSPTEVQVEAAGGETTRLQAAKGIIWASGSLPLILPIPGHDGPGIFTSDDAVDLPGPPEDLVIIGAGALGCEFAYIYSRFGTRVTLLEMMPGIVPTEDPEAAEVLAKALKKGGVKIVTGAKAAAIEHSEDKKTLVYEQDGEEKNIACDMVLMAAGRRANTADMGLETAGITLDRGRISVNESLHTGVESVYAVGDCVRGIGLAHWASHEGVAVIDTLLGDGGHINLDCVPAGIFTHPEIGSVGLRAHEAAAQGIKVDVGSFPFSALGKAQAIRQREGFVKIVAEKNTGRVLGGTIVGPGATDLIAEIALAVQMGLTAADIAHTMHSHPTLSEAVGEAALATFGAALHIP